MEATSGRRKPPMQQRYSILPSYGNYQTATDHRGTCIVLGEGGFGVTVRARRMEGLPGSETAKEYAIKILRDQNFSETRLARFKREIDKLRELEHQNLVQYKDCGVESGCIYLVLDLCNGGNLSTLVNRFGAMSERLGLEIIRQIAEGLFEVHARGYFHRDIKPDNILLKEDLHRKANHTWLEKQAMRGHFHFKLADFGLAVSENEARARSGGFAGTHMFACPEQFREQAIDARSDIYSLGMTLWFLVLGHKPYKEPFGPDNPNPHTRPQPHDAEFPDHWSPGFRALLSRMVKKNPAERFASARELADAVRDLLKQAPALADPSADPAWGKGRFADYYDESHSVRISRRPVGDFRRIRRSVSAAKNLGAEADAEIGLTYWSAAHPSEEPVERSIGLYLNRLKEWTNDPEAADLWEQYRVEISRILQVRRTKDQWCLEEEWRAGEPLNRFLQLQGRAVTFAQVAQLLWPIANACELLNRFNADYSRAAHADSAAASPEHGRIGALLGVDHIHIVSPLATSNNDDWLKRPMSEWGEWGVRMSLVALPREFSEPEEISGATTSASHEFPSDSSNLTNGFCRLLYRMIEGREVPSAADWDVHSYTNADRLGAPSNILLRDAICGKLGGESPVEILRQVCRNEGNLRWPPLSAPAAAHASLDAQYATISATLSGNIPVGREASKSDPAPRSSAAEPAGARPASRQSHEAAKPSPSARPPASSQPLHSPTPAQHTARSVPYRSIDQTVPGRSVDPLAHSQAPDDLKHAEYATLSDRPGWVVSPYGSASEQKISGEQWRRDGVVMCEETQRPFRLPRQLPPLDAILIPGCFDEVLTPYLEKETRIPVPPGKWRRGEAFSCRETGLKVRMPLALVPPVAEIVPDRVGWVLLPFPGRHVVEVSHAQWEPNRHLADEFGQEFSLPDEKTLPLLTATLDPKRTTWITSPYKPEEPFEIDPADCLPGQVLKCRWTGNRIKLPDNLYETWRFEGKVEKRNDEAEVRSPFVREEEAAWQKVPIAKWHPGEQLTCSVTGATFHLPAELPPLKAEATTNRGEFTSPLGNFTLDAWACVAGNVVEFGGATGQSVRLPKDLPENWLWPGEVRQVGDGEPEVMSPFLNPSGQRDWQRIEENQWQPGARITCQKKDRVFVLPQELPRLQVKAGPAEGTVLSPFKPNAPITVPDGEWKPGDAVTVRLPSGISAGIEIPAGFKNVVPEPEEEYFETQLHIIPEPVAKAAVPTTPVIPPAGRSVNEAAFETLVQQEVPAISSDAGSNPPAGEAQSQEVEAVGYEPVVNGKIAKIRSPFGIHRQITVAPAQWRPDRLCRCDETGEFFHLPKDLPLLEAEHASKPRMVICPHCQKCSSELSPTQWKLGARVRCEHCSESFVIPNKLPQWEAKIDPARPGWISSPYDPEHAYPLTIEEFHKWSAGAILECPSTARQFCLPQGLPLWLPDAELIPERPGWVRSPFKSRREIEIKGPSWKAGELIICPETRRNFKLPANLPPLAAVLMPSKPGYVQSPYATQPKPIKVPQSKWKSGYPIRCPETRLEMLMPAEILPPHGAAHSWLVPAILILLGLGIVAGGSGYVLRRWVSSRDVAPGVTTTPAPVVANTPPQESTPPPPVAQVPAPAPAATAAPAPAPPAPAAPDWPKKVTVFYRPVGARLERFTVRVDGKDLGTATPTSNSVGEVAIDFTPFHRNLQTASKAQVLIDGPHVIGAAELSRTDRPEIQLPPVTLDRKQATVTFGAISPFHKSFYKGITFDLQEDTGFDDKKTTFDFDTSKEPFTVPTGTYRIRLRHRDSEAYDLIDEKKLITQSTSIALPPPLPQRTIGMAATFGRPYVCNYYRIKGNSPSVPPADCTYWEERIYLSPIIAYISDDYRRVDLYEENSMLGPVSVSLMERLEKALKPKESLVGDAAITQFSDAMFFDLARGAQQMPQYFDFASLQPRLRDKLVSNESTDLRRPLPDRIRSKRDKAFEVVQKLWDASLAQQKAKNLDIINIHALEYRVEYHRELWKSARSSNLLEAALGTRRLERQEVDQLARPIALRPTDSNLLNGFIEQLEKTRPREFLFERDASKNVLLPGVLIKRSYGLKMQESGAISLTALPGAGGTTYKLRSFQLSVPQNREEEYGDLPARFERDAQGRYHFVTVAEPYKQACALRPIE